jgi:hypothetical protein
MLLIGVSGHRCLVFRFWMADERWEKVDIPIGTRLPWPIAFPMSPTSALLMSGSVDTELFYVQDAGKQIEKVVTTGVPPFSEAGKKVDSDTVLEPMSNAAVIYGEWLIVFGDREWMQSYGISLSAPSLKWFAIKSNTEPPYLQSRSSYGYCVGENCIWIHGGITRCEVVDSGLFKVQVKGQDEHAVMNQRVHSEFIPALNLLH